MPCLSKFWWGGRSSKDDGPLTEQQEIRKLAHGLSKKVRSCNV